MTRQSRSRVVFSTPDFPGVTKRGPLGDHDLYVAKITPDGYAQGNPIAGAATNSADVPVTAGALRRPPAGAADVLLAKFDVRSCLGVTPASQPTQ